MAAAPLDRAIAGLLTFLLLSSGLGQEEAFAGTPSADAKKGLALAKKGDCVAAMPLLEKAEEKHHTPATLSALAGCHLALGDLLLARDLFRAVADDHPKASWSHDDRLAQAAATEKVDTLDARIPVVTFEVEPHVDGLEITVGDLTVDDPEAGAPLAPDVKVKLTIEAPGYVTLEDTLVLSERQRRRYPVHLVKSGGSKAKTKPRESTGDHPTTWIGARFRGQLVPKLWMSLVADGGATAYAPGVELTLTQRLGNWDLVPSAGFTSYRLGPTPFKPHGRPNTEWEIDESNLAGLELKLDVLYRISLDHDENVSLRIGGGIGFGAMPFGNLRRTQAYPKGDPNDPAAYVKCLGPNNPAGTFRYCNQLDKDVKRYGQADKAWGDGGARPIIYPWLTLPEIGLEWDVTRWVAFDLEVGVTLTGFLTGAGVRFGL